MTLEIWSDIACSWCYVGKRRLEAALAQFEHRDEVDVVWRSFELDPTAPKTAPAKSGAALLAELRGISLPQARAMQQQMTDLAAAEGVGLDFERLQPVSTFDAHRLLHLARAHGRQGALQERLLRAYFTEGERLSDPATLARLAAEVGLPAAAVAQVLAGDAYGAAVREDEQTAGELGARGVPFLVIDRALAAAGALAPVEMLHFLRQGWAAQPRGPAPLVGATCGPEGC